MLEVALAPPGPVVVVVTLELATVMVVGGEPIADARAEVEIATEQPVGHPAAALEYLAGAEELAGADELGPALE